MSSSIRIRLAIIAALILIISGWTSVIHDSTTLVACGVGVVVVAGFGMAGRALGLPAAATVVAQVLGIAAWGAFVVLPATGPDPAGIQQAVARGWALIRDGVAPLEPHLGVTLLLVGMTATAALLTDLFAVTFARPAHTFIVLLGLFLVPAFGPPGPVGFDQVIRFGLGYGLILAAASPLLDDRRRSVRTAAWAIGAVVVSASLALASFVGGHIPVTASLAGQDQLQMTNPALDLKRNLTQGSTEPVLTYTTDQPTGAYLKLATLTAFDANGFSLDAVRVGMGPFPSPPGLREAGERRTTHVQISGFDSEWLPVPYAPSAVRAPDRWGFAHETLDVMAMTRDDRKTATRGLEYEVRSIDVRPSRAQVGAASSTELAGEQRYLETPMQLPARIRELTRVVTEGAPTDGARAQAIEAFLLSDRFRYSTAHSEGDSMSTLDDFLFDSRSGYCEQFAGAMVAMARVAGLPARMAVGFTPGSHSDGVWQVSSRDMHTWPEIWLDGWGWVAFEPTPASGVPTTNVTPPAMAPEPSATVSVTQTPEPSDVPEPDPGDPEPEEGTPDPDDTPGPAADPAPLVGFLLGVIAILAVAGAPAALRARRRAQRLAGGRPARVAALSAWDEVVDTASDLGVPWPDGSPRYAAEDVAALLPDAAAERLRRLAQATEQAMFDHPDAYAGRSEWASSARAIREGLRAQSTRSQRLRATWWPRSLWRR